MLRELDAARSETEAMLARQRQFVADASHELRTPLTSVLANLELLAESLHGDQGEAARSALRSSQRMRRLVADLLLLARTDAARVVAREPCDLAQIVVEAAGRARPGQRATTRSRSTSSRRRSMGARDELHRLAINLIENALRHTRRAPTIRGRHAHRRGRQRRSWSWRTTAPGCRPSSRRRCSSASCAAPATAAAPSASGWRSSRRSPASTAATVALEPRGPAPTGARFVVRCPAGSDLDDDRQHHRPALQPVID